MVKKIIAGVVAGILLMAWQTASHTALKLHASQEQYTPNHAAILEALNKNLDKSGMYFLPGLPPGASMELMEQAQKDWAGKPWAVVNYNTSFNTNMTSNILRGLATNIVLGLVLAWLVGRLRSPGFAGIFGASLAVGFLAFGFHPYPGHIWYETPGIRADLIDSLAAFGLAGAWLGWYIPRGQKAG
jgi:hypothetical protein